MNKKTKKIIAREFLIILIMIALGLLIFVCIFPYNSYQNKQINKIENSISKKEKTTDSLHKSVNAKKKNQEWFFNKVSSEFDITNSEYSELKTLWPILQRIAENDSTEYRWNNKWEQSLIDFHKGIGFKNAQELEKFIETNSLNAKDSIQLEKSTLIRNEILGLKKRKIELENKVFDEYDRMDLLAGIGIILFGILFILRYLFYAVKWSIKTLKE